MVSKGLEKFVIYPIYFDKKVSRKDGRKVTKKQAIEKPAIDDIFKAAKSLGLNPEIEKEVSYPSRHWKNEGRVVIDQKDSKNNLLRKISKKL